MLKTKLLYFILVLLSVHLSAQPINNDVGDIVPPSPNVAALNKYTDLPVSKFTGVPSISIPIHTIQDGPIQVPISLSYHASGLKLGETASWVGLGWNLSTGGMVSRSVIGGPDDRPGGKGYIQGGFRNLQIEDAFKQGYDTEADVFSLNFGGYSGRMTYSTGPLDGNEPGWNLYPFENIKVETFYQGDEIEGFEFTMPNGIKYLFGMGLIEKTVTDRHPHPDPAKESTTGWYLKKITSADDKYYVEYHYVDENYKFGFLGSNDATYGSLTSPGVCGVAEESEVETIYSVVSGKRVTHITTSRVGSQVSFIAEKPREDIEPFFNNALGAPNLLSQIKIEEGNACKAFQLSHSYWGVNNTFSDEKRLKLNEVQEKSCIGQTTIPPYIFTYEDKVDGQSHELPSRLSKQIDHWGYYNGKAGNDNKSTLIPYNASIYDRRYDLTYLYHNGDYNLGSDRESDAAYSKFGVLTNITYPTGGSVDLAYEGNEEYGVVTGNRQQFVRNVWSSCNTDGFANSVDGPMALSQAEMDDAEYQVWFDLMNDSPAESACTCPGRFGVIIEAFPSHDIDNGVPISIATGDAFQVQNPECQLGYSFGPFPMTAFSPALTPGVKYEYRIKPDPNPTFDNVGTAFFEINYSPEENHEIGGLRIKTMTKNNTATETTTYNYRDEHNNSTGKVLIEPRYGYVVHEYGIDMRVFSSASLVSTSDIHGYTHGYKSVTTVTGDVMSKYSFNLIKTISTAYPVVPIPPNYTNGQAEKTEHYNDLDDTQVVSTVNYAGQRRNMASVGEDYSIKARMFTCPSSPSCTACPANYEYWLTTHYYSSYPGYYAPSQIVERVDNLTTTTSYGYGRQDLTQATSVSISGPQAGKQTDYTFATPDDRLFYDKNMVSIPIETKIDGGAGGGSKTVFDEKEGYIVPLEFYRWDDDRGDWTWVAKHKDHTIDGRPQTIEKIGFDSNRPIITQSLTWQDRLLTSITTGDRTQSFDYYYDMHRQLKNLTTIDGQTTDFEYDPLWRLKKEESRDGIITNEYDYNYAPYHNKNAVSKVVKIIGAEYAFSTEEGYDAFGRPVESIKKEYAASGNNWSESQVFNALGSVINKCSPAQGSCYNYTYYPSALQRLHTEKQGNWPREVEYTYGAQNNLFKTSRISEDGVETKTLTDGLGRTRSTIDGLGQSTNYDYDSRGNITSITGPAGAYIYRYDGLGRLESKTVPDGGEYIYTYYDNDLLKTTTDPKGQSTTNNYTQYGELEYVYQGTSASGTPISTYTYGSGAGDAGKLLTSNVYTSLGGQATQSFTYDGYGRVTNQSTSTGYLGASYDHVDIDNADFVKKTMRSDGVEYNMGYDHGGRQTSSSARWNNTTINTRNKYNDSDWRTVHYLGGNAEKPWQKVDYGYNERGWLTRINGIEEIRNQEQEDEIPFISEDDLIALIAQLGIKYHIPDLVNCLPTNFYVYLAGQIKILTGPDKGDYTVSGGKTSPINGGKIGATYDTDDRYDIVGEPDMQQLTAQIQTAILQKINLPTNPKPGDPGYPCARIILDWIERELPQILIDLFAELYPDDLEPDCYDPKTPNQCVGCPDCPEYSPCDLFAEEIYYQQGDASINAMPWYAGNISHTKWLTSYGGPSRSYTYDYDVNDRLLRASSGRESLPPAGASIGQWSLNGLYDVGMGYDGAGNIQSIDRSGLSEKKPNGELVYGGIDDLTLTYGNPTKPNQLTSISESTDDAYLAKGFKPYNQTMPTSGSIEYDDNGNMTRNDFKGIDNITYDLYNYPKVVTFEDGSTMEMDYSADGNKLWMKVSKVGESPKEFKYLDGMVVTTTDASFYADGGRITDADGDYRAEYTISDHLGNGRVWFTDLNNDGEIACDHTEVLQQEEFYPFGMAQEGSWQNYDGNPEGTDYLPPVPGDQNDRYTYNGKEIENDLTGWLDYGVRWYDPSVGRFMGNDPLAEDYASFSPYNYSFDNPIRFTDPDGAAPRDAVKDCCPGMDVKFRVNSTGVTRQAEDYAVERGGREITIGVAIGASFFIPGPEDVVLGAGVLKYAAGLLKGKKAVKAADNAVEITIDGSKHPESAKHLQEAMDAGKSNEGVIDRAGAASRRKENLKGVKTKKGMDRDEAPPAVINTGEKASVKHINPSDNRGAGSSIGHQIKKLDNGTKVRIVPRNLPD